MVDISRRLTLLSPTDPFDLTISRQLLAVPPCEAFVLRASGWPVVDWWCEATLRDSGWPVVDWCCEATLRAGGLLESCR